ncbi:MAG: hypothetical protein M3P24_01865 [Gemmatimonadota bacterium]|nr:hypothetical protein [Gemmatimonadota bacterium]
MSVNLGHPIARQQLERSLRSGRGNTSGQKLTVEVLKRRYARNVPDIYQRIIALQDSLLLAPEQVDALRKAQVKYQAEIDAVWTELAVYLVNLPDEYDIGEALRRQEAATDRAWELSRREGPTIRSIISPFQLQLLGGVVRDVIEADRQLRVRIYSRQ